MSEFDPKTPPPSDRTTVPYRPAPKPLGTRAISWLRLWVRDTFSRDQMISSLKSLAWVAPLTIVIWVYAEREQLAKVDTQTIPITVTSADPKMIVTVNPDDQNIIAELSGPRVSVDKVTEELKLIPKNDRGVIIEIPSSYGQGPQIIQSARVSDADLFKKAGVTVTKASPQNIHITVDKLVDRDVDVLPPPDMQNLVGTPTFEPRKVQITGPETVIRDAETKGQLNVFADFKGRTELRSPGKHTLENVPLTVSITDKNVTISQSIAKAAVEVRQADVELTKTMPVYVTYPLGFDKNYHAEFDGTLRDVKLYGPSDIIEAMQRPNFESPPRARFDVGPKDIGSDGQTHTAKLQFDLPPGVRVSDDDKLRTIDFHVTKQGAAE